MKAFDLPELEQNHHNAGKLYYELIREASLSVGLYILPAGASDPQQPHTEDEVYYIISGRAMIRVGHEDRPISTGSVIFVGKHEEHHFHSIEEDLKIMVFFAPAEYSQI